MKFRIVENFNGDRCIFLPQYSFLPFFWLNYEAKNYSGPEYFKTLEEAETYIKNKIDIYKTPKNKPYTKVVKEYQ